MAQAKENIKVDLNGVKILAFLFRNKLNKILALKAAELLKFSIYGSSRAPEKAPIDVGILRQSASVFVGSKMVEKSDFPLSSSRLRPKRTIYPPTVSYNERDKLKITVIFNAPYAFKMHNIRYNPGEWSIKDGNSKPGNKWLYKHLMKDGPWLFNSIGKDLKKSIFNK